MKNGIFADFLGNFDGVVDLRSRHRSQDRPQARVDELSLDVFCPDVFCPDVRAADSSFTYESLVESWRRDFV